MPVKYAPIEQKLLEGFQILLPPGIPVNFQFPPKIKSDNMTGDFKNVGEGNSVPGIYPAFSYAGPNERVWSLETTYIIDGDKWTNAKVRGECGKLRSYYFDIRNVIDQDAAGILIRLWGFGGVSETTAFMRGLSIKHSDTLILPTSEQTVNSIGSDSYAKDTTVSPIDNVYSLRTDVSFDLVMWWNFQPVGQKTEPMEKGVPAMPEGSEDRMWY